MTHTTNPEVAPCRAPVLGPRFVVGMLEVYRVNLQTLFGHLRYIFLGRARLGAPQHGPGMFSHARFWAGERHVTHKSKAFQRESAHASGTIRKPAMRSTR